MHIFMIFGSLEKGRIDEFLPSKTKLKHPLEYARNSPLLSKSNPFYTHLQGAHFPRFSPYTLSV